MVREAGCPAFSEFGPQARSAANEMHVKGDVDYAHFCIISDPLSADLSPAGSWTQYIGNLFEAIVPHA